MSPQAAAHKLFDDRSPRWWGVANVIFASLLVTVTTLLTHSDVQQLWCK